MDKLPRQISSSTDALQRVASSDVINFSGPGRRSQIAEDGEVVVDAEQPTVSQRDNGRVSSSLFCLFVCVCVCVRQRSWIWHEEAESDWFISAKVVGGRTNGHSGGLLCRLVDVPLCLSVGLPLRGLPQHPQYGSNLEIGSTANTSGVAERREKSARAGDIHLNFWKVVGKCRARIFKKALPERGECCRWRTPLV